MISLLSSIIQEYKVTKRFSLVFRRQHRYQAKSYVATATALNDLFIHLNNLSSLTEYLRCGRFRDRA